MHYTSRVLASFRLSSSRVLLFSHTISSDRCSSDFFQKFPSASSFSLQILFCFFSFYFIPKTRYARIRHVIAWGLVYLFFLALFAFLSRSFFLSFLSFSLSILHTLILSRSFLSPLPLTLSIPHAISYHLSFFAYIDILASSPYSASFTKFFPKAPNMDLERIENNAYFASKLANFRISKIIRVPLRISNF